jgi:hypothetical protein
MLVNVRQAFRSIFSGRRTADDWVYFWKNKTCFEYGVGRHKICPYTKFMVVWVVGGASTMFA